MGKGDETAGRAVDLQLEHRHVGHALSRSHMTPRSAGIRALPYSDVRANVDNIWIARIENDRVVRNVNWRTDIDPSGSGRQSVGAFENVPWLAGSGFVESGQRHVEHVSRSWIEG